MELLLKTSNNKFEQNFNWDIDVVDGIASVVPESAEEDQEAAVVTYLEKTTIPLMEDKGVDWVGFLLKSRTLAEIDTEVRSNLKTYLGSVLYSPMYTPGDEGALNIHLAKTYINTGATV